MKEYLFLFTITPVQGFIEQSRKTQDLYAGSAILSYLCRQAALIVQNEWQANIIFPDVELHSLPNRFLASVEGEKEDSLKEKGHALEQRIYAKLEEVFDYFLKFYGLSKPSGAWSQIENYFNFYWVFCPVDEGYAEAYKKIESYLGQIKTRVFPPFVEESGRKCTLTGEHNALFFRRKKEGTQIGIELNQRVPLKYLAQGEALGAVGFLKRVAPLYFKNYNLESSPYGSSFPSTAHIALADTFERLSCDSPKMSDLLQKEFNEELIYDLYYKQPLEYATEEELKIANQIYDEIDNKRYRLTPYYAIIIFDGDNMGKWLSGEKLIQEKKGQLRDFHQHLSRELAKFARIAAEEILVAPKGATVYAGGDDFLGFINLNYLPSILKELRSEFEKIDLSEFSTEKLTFSAGIVLSHYKTPLSEALRWARHMEKEAKDVGGKDALSIAVLRRSGEITKFKTKAFNSQGWFADQLQFLLDELGQHFTTNFINQFFTEFIHFEGKMETMNLDGMVEGELNRLLNRSYVNNPSDGGLSLTEEKKEQKIAEMKRVLNNLYIESNLMDFLGLLKTLSFLAREVEDCAIKM